MKCLLVIAKIIILAAFVNIIPTISMNATGPLDDTSGRATELPADISNTTDSGSVSNDSSTSTSSIKILLTSDIAYNIFPVHSANHSVCMDSEVDLTATECIGGLSRLVRYVDDGRADNDQLLVVDAGNVAGQSYFPQLKFNPLTSAVQRLNYTAMAMDAELLKYGADAMQHGFLAGSGDAVTAVNLDLGSTGPQKSRRVTVNNCEVVIIGVVNSSRIEELSVPGVNTSDEVSAVKQELQNLTSGASASENIVTIVVGTIDVTAVEAIASLKGVDLVIVSGTNISDLEAGVGELANVTYQGNSYVVTVQRNVNFPFVVSELELMMENSSCNVTDIKAGSMDYSSYNESDDEAVREMERAGITRLHQMTSLSLAVSTATVPTAGCGTEECALGNLVSDAVVSQLLIQGQQDAPRLAVYPGRRFLNDTQLSTDVTGTAIDALFEGDEFLYTVSVSAPQLKSMFEDHVAHEDDSNFLQISGLMQVQLDRGQPAGSRVAGMKVVSGDSVTFSAVDLANSTDIYSVAVPASMLQNSTLQEAPHSFHLLSIGEAIKTHALQAGVLVALPAGSRVTYTPDIPATTSTQAPSASPATACHDNTATTVIVTLFVAALCVAGAMLFWIFAVPRIRSYRARRNSSLPLVVR